MAKMVHYSGILLPWQPKNRRGDRQSRIYCQEGEQHPWILLAGGYRGCVVVAGGGRALQW